MESPTRNIVEDWIINAECIANGLEPIPDGCYSDKYGHNDDADTVYAAEWKPSDDDETGGDDPDENGEPDNTDGPEGQPAPQSDDGDDQSDGDQDGDGGGESDDESDDDGDGAGGGSGESGDDADDDADTAVRAVMVTSQVQVNPRSANPARSRSPFDARV